MPCSLPVLPLGKPALNWVPEGRFGHPCPRVGTDLGSLFQVRGKPIRVDWTLQRKCRGGERERKGCSNSIVLECEREERRGEGKVGEGKLTPAALVSLWDGESKRRGRGGIGGEGREDSQKEIWVGGPTPELRGGRGRGR